MKKIPLLLLVIITIFSCNETPTKATDKSVKAPIDSLISNWENNWNKHDSAGVRNMFLVDAVLVDDNLVTVNADAISEKWLHPYINVVNNVKSTKLQEWSEGNRASYTGKYALDVVIKDSVIARPEGVFTVNWLKTEKGDWKISSAIIHSFKK